MHHEYMDVRAEERVENIIARVQLNGSLVGDIVLYITSMPTAVVGKGMS